MNKKILVVALLVVVLLVSLMACDAIGGFSGISCAGCVDELGDIFDFDTRDARDADEIEAINSTEESNDPETSDSDTPDIPGDAEDSGFGGADGDLPLVIEIIENRILHKGADISLEELESLLLLHIDNDYTWELHDAHQAVKAVYDDVVDLFNKHGVTFREKLD